MTKPVCQREIFRDKSAVTDVESPAGCIFIVSQDIFLPSQKCVTTIDWLGEYGSINEQKISRKLQGVLVFQTHLMSILVLQFEFNNIA